MLDLATMIIRKFLGVVLPFREIAIIPTINLEFIHRSIGRTSSMNQSKGILLFPKD